MRDRLRLPAHAVTEKFVNSKVEFLEDIHVWPERDRLDPYAWLGNFTSDDRPFALNLLNVFLYYNEAIVDAMFRGAVQRLSASIISPATSLDEAKDRWRLYLKTVWITYVEGEQPNPTDSGYLFARKARQVLGVD